MPSPMTSIASSMERWSAQLFKIEYCTIVEVDRTGLPGVQCHSPDHPEYYNTVTLKVRDAKLGVDPHKLEHNYEIIIQDFVGHCFGHIYTPRVGDLVQVLFIYNKQPIILGPVNTKYQTPPFRGPTSADAMYDEVWKWCQWLRPTMDENHDYGWRPQGRMPICKKLFHGPVDGVLDNNNIPGKGRDEQKIWDCQMGHCDPTCRLCETIDSVPRLNEQWFKQYSTKTESAEAYNSRMEWHARCGSYLRFESDDENTARQPSHEYSEEIGHIRLGNAVSETDKRFHFNIQGDSVSGSNGVGTFDLHTNYEIVPIGRETTGVRIAGIRPEDTQVNWAWELMNFPTNSYIRCYKSGDIDITAEDYITETSDVEIDLITPLVHVHEDMQIDGNLIITGTLTHGGSSCCNPGTGTNSGWPSSNGTGW
jgi:hypothetical protein